MLAMPASSGRRSAIRLGGTALVSQAKAPYIHQIELSIRETGASALAIRMVGEHRRQLRDREDEDEIEEELDRADTDLVPVRLHSVAGPISVTRRAMLLPRRISHRRFLSALASNFNI